MKLIALIAAGLLSTVVAAPASAQMQERHNTRVVTRTVVHTEHGRHDGWRNHHRTRKVCTNRWRHGHRVRVCRTVRY